MSLAQRLEQPADAQSVRPGSLGSCSGSGCLPLQLHSTADSPLSMPFLCQPSKMVSCTQPSLPRLMPATANQLRCRGECVSLC